MRNFYAYFEAAERRKNGQSAHVAQSAERVLGKDEVTGSNPVVGSEKERCPVIGRDNKRTEIEPGGDRWLRKSLRGQSHT